MSGETDWSNFRVGAMSLATFAKRAVIHADLVREVLRRASGGILEVGVGSGAQSALLSRFAARVVSLDNDRRILSAARPNLARFGPAVRLVAADAFSMPFEARSFGVAVSQGLLEHFPDEQIALLLREQLRVCRSIACSVPSDHYPRQDVGNERLMPPSRWQAIAEAAVDPRRFVVRARYYRPDPEAWKYSLLARRRLGSFSVLITVDPR